MKKALVVLLAAAMVFGLMALAGCGEKKATIKGPEGEEIEVTEEGGKVTVEGEDGEKTSWSTEEVSEEDLGVPIYPGAKLEEGSATEVTTEGEEGTATWSGGVLLTKDPVSEVIAWYKEELSGKPGFQDTTMKTNGEELGSFAFQSGDETKSVFISADDSEEGVTSIVVNTSTGMPEMPVPGE